MCSLDSLKINLKGLCEELTTFDFRLDNDYFAAIETSEVRRGVVNMRLVVKKITERLFELDFHLDGIVIIPCDRCLDDMEQPIKTEGHLIVKLGKEYSEEDELVTVDENEGMLDTSWFIYEFISLAIPIKHVHAPGKCNSAMIELLKQHSVTRSSEGTGEHLIDPRWSGLQQLVKNQKIKN